MIRFAFAAAAAFAATPAVADMAVSIPFAAEIAGQHRVTLGADK